MSAGLNTQQCTPIKEFAPINGTRDGRVGGQTTTSTHVARMYKIRGRQTTHKHDKRRGCSQTGEKPCTNARRVENGRKKFKDKPDKVSLQSNKKKKRRKSLSGKRKREVWRGKGRIQNQSFDTKCEGDGIRDIKVGKVKQVPNEE